MELRLTRVHPNSTKTGVVVPSGITLTNSKMMQTLHEAQQIIQGREKENIRLI